MLQMTKQWIHGLLTLPHSTVPGLKALDENLLWRFQGWQLQTRPIRGKYQTILSSFLGVTQRCEGNDFDEHRKKPNYLGHVFKEKKTIFPSSSSSSGVLAIQRRHLHTPGNALPLSYVPRPHYQHFQLTVSSVHGILEATKDNAGHTGNDKKQKLNKKQYTLEELCSMWSALFNKLFVHFNILFLMMMQVQ